MRIAEVIAKRARLAEQYRQAALSGDTRMADHISRIASVDKPLREMLQKIDAEIVVEVSTEQAFALFFGAHAQACHA